jgi:serine/threonine protein kinase
MLDALPPGTVFADRYEVVRCIGKGGMGAVYEVVHTRTQRRRAMKILHPGLMSDDDARERFAKEASITANVDSEHLVDVFDAGLDEATRCPFIVMELLKGESLGERLQNHGRLPVDELLTVLGQVGGALEKTHQAGIIHRDLKPDNLFVTRKADGSAHAKILDFGIAKAVDPVASMSRNTSNIGTPLYMAPEQLEGAKLDARADLYALGHIAFELLTGESYWENELRGSASSIALLRHIEAGPPEPASERARRLGVDVGPELDAWFMKAIARDPKDRFASATELVDAFSHALAIPSTAPTVEIPAASRPSDLLATPRPSAAAFSAIDEPSTSDLTTRRQEPRPEEMKSTSSGMVTPTVPPRRSRVLGVALIGAACAAGAAIFVLPRLWGSGSVEQATASHAAGVPDPASASASALAASSSAAASPAPASASASASATVTSASPKKRPPQPPRRTPEFCAKYPSRCR